MKDVSSTTTTTYYWITNPRSFIKVITVGRFVWYIITFSSYDCVIGTWSTKVMYTLPLIHRPMGSTNTRAAVDGNYSGSGEGSVIFVNVDGGVGVVSRYYEITGGSDKNLQAQIFSVLFSAR